MFGVKRREARMNIVPVRIMNDDGDQKPMIHKAERTEYETCPEKNRCEAICNQPCEGEVCYRILCGVARGEEYSVDPYFTPEELAKGPHCGNCARIEKAKEQSDGSI